MFAWVQYYIKLLLWSLENIPEELQANGAADLVFHWMYALQHV